MSLLFDRQYNLVIGKPNSNVSVLLNTPETLSEGYTAIPFISSDWRTEVRENNAVQITDLQFTATIKSSSSNSNTSDNTVIRILNLSKETRSIIEAINNYIILEAGYKEDEKLEMIFSGQVIDYHTKREGRDLVTTLVCSGGYTPNNSIKVSKSFDKTNTYGDILRYFAQAYADNGVPTGEIIDDWGAGSDITIQAPLPVTPAGILAENVKPEYLPQIPVLIKRPANTKVGMGYSARGYLRQALEEICEQIGYVSYITNGRLFIHPKGFTRTVEQYEFSANQVKSIRKAGKQGTGSSKNVNQDGIELVTFLDGRLDVDKRLKLLDGEFEGEYKIMDCSHELNYEHSPWDTTVFCRKVV